MRACDACSFCPARTHHGAGGPGEDDQDFQETINLLDAAIKLDSNYAEALSNRGVAKGALNRNIEAVKDFTKAIEIDPFKKSCHIFIASEKHYFMPGQLPTQKIEKVIS